MENITVRHLIIRADAGTEIGSGHLMRCLALGQAWKDAGGKVVFITACHCEGLLQRLREEDFQIHLLAGQYPDNADWDDTSGVLDTHPNAWVVLDGYHLDEGYQQRVKESGHRLLVIDDMAHLKHYYADIVLNQNLHAEQLHYPCETYTSLLLGTRYVLLRREFLVRKDRERDISETARCVLVTLGGADPRNHTFEIIQALQSIDISGLEVTVVVGASNPHKDVLERTVNQSCFPIHIVHDANNMLELMMWADLAVCAAGSTVWELAYMGVPMLITTLAQNQEAIARALVEEGMALNFNKEEIPSLLLDRHMRITMNQKAEGIVDGRGTEHVVKILRNGT